MHYTRYKNFSLPARSTVLRIFYFLVVFSRQLLHYNDSKVGTLRIIPL